jgi:hypothetical protein
MHRSLAGDPRALSRRRILVIADVVSLSSELIDGYGFHRQWLPSSIRIAVTQSFHSRGLMSSAVFEGTSRLSQIEPGAFSRSRSRAIHLPRSIEEICESSFYRCTSLVSITFDANSRLQRIERHAFALTGVNEIALPGDLVSISGSAFLIRELHFISIYGFSRKFGVKDGFLRDISGWDLTRYFGVESIVNVNCSVEVICESCFSSLTGIINQSTAFDSDSKLRRLEEQTFCERALRVIHLPASVEVICESCFSCCQSMTSVTFDSDSKLSRLEREAFDWSGLTAIHLPASIEVICESCFAGCGSRAFLASAVASKLSRIETTAFLTLEWAIFNFLLQFE